MPSLYDLYATRRPIAEYTLRSARDALNAFASERGFLVDGRIKEFESLADKMQSGRYKSFNDLDDLVALTIIIDTRNQEKEVISFLSRAFRVERIKRNTIVQNENQFSFDCTRMYLTIPTVTGNAPSKIVVFEVQIRTILQHAWSKITHPLVYKTSRFNSQKSRLAAEMMAHIESMDRTLATFATTSRTVRRIANSGLEDLNVISSAFERLFEEELISREFEQKNNKKLAENVASILEKRDRGSIKTAADAIHEYVSKNRDFIPKSISLFEISLLAIEQKGLLRRNLRRIYMSDELLSLYPHMNKLVPRVELKG